MGSNFLIDTDSMRVEYFKNPDFHNNKIAFIFSVFGHRNLDGNPYGGEIFYKNGYDVISFKVNSDDWFQSIPLDFFQNLKSIIQENKYIKKLAYGSSMGGFASIVFSKTLEVDTVIAISPQFSIDEPFDKRWEAQAKKINFVYRINKSTLSEKCEYYIIYDNKDPDELHVERILEVMTPNICCNIIKIPFSGHPATNYLSEIGVLKDLALQISNKNSTLGFDFFSNRNKSKSYLLSLSHNLSKRNHPIWALSAINSAIQLDSANAWFYREKSHILYKIGNLEDAIASSRMAVDIEPNNSEYHHNLSCLLDSAGLLDEAISESKKSIILLNKNSNYYCHIGNLYCKLGDYSKALNFLKFAINLDFNVAWFHRQLSQVLLRLGRVDDAIYSIRIASILSPDVVQYKNELVELRLKGPLINIEFLL